MKTSKFKIYKNDHLRFSLKHIDVFVTENKLEVDEIFLRVILFCISVDKFEKHFNNF